ncbi:MAG: DEAD/DEAH box helicase [Thermodesulfobacteriota bacterium]
MESPNPFRHSRIEFHRQGLALVPDESERRPGTAYLIKANKREPSKRFCSCSLSARKTCAHLLKLAEEYKALVSLLGGKTPDEVFRLSPWYQWATLLARGTRESVKSVKLQFIEQGPSRIIRILGAKDQEMAFYLSSGPDADLLIERLGQVPAHGVPSRAALIEKLAELTVTDNERFFNQKGYKTNGQIFEEHVWYRFAYHCFQEFYGKEIAFSPAIDEETGQFMVSGKYEQQTFFHWIIPRDRVKGFLRDSKDLLTNHHGLTIHPLPLRSIFKISATTEMDLEIRPMVQLLQADGEKKYLEKEEREKYQYGELLYVQELGILAELERPGPLERKFQSPVKMILKKSQVPSFLNEFGQALQEGAHLVDASVKNLKIYDRVSKMELSPTAIDRDWCWLSVDYGFGNSSLSLKEILQARKEGQRFISLKDGWVDCRSAEFEGFALWEQDLTEGGEKPGEKDLRFSRLDLLRLQALSPSALKVVGNTPQTIQVKAIFDLMPAKPLSSLKGLVSPLRTYQRQGVDWLSFLFENRLGGLLCDDMGLGKTHQVMALMVKLREEKKEQRPFLVICPTTVLSHWVKKIADHTRGLHVRVFHGGDRELDKRLKGNQVLLTTYGILRNDIDRLKEISFSLAVFDEIQNLKNPETQAHQAARMLQAGIKVGLTGTPIENNLMDLKALFDLTVPGFLGSSESFQENYIKPIDQNLHSQARKRLNRLISPFVLRRLKASVLNELPEKIEDLRFCPLSEDQIRLYREALAGRGKDLLKTLKDQCAPVPYMHIFALLTLLKQICNHPALALKKIDQFETYASGKWELFQELLDEGLGSGQKIVVYSQFLGMIKIMEHYLTKTGWGYVTLTGSSRKRGELIDRFNQDPECRIFLGSLKAGGVGIDLVAASMVIHYDRWWNAAREDQATDRVHRIGQRRGVQVFKLITAGTLEEKIAAIIERKKNLMEAVVKEDDPNLLKTFTREDLIELLS